MVFKDFTARAEERLFIIAEAGVNHDGDIDQAFKLVDAAVEAGCDAVKFQTWITEKVYCRTNSIKPDYQKRATDEAESEYDTIARLELGFEAFRTLKAYCDQRGIIFFSTPDEMDSARFLASLDLPLMKTASQDVTNLPFLADLADLGMPLIYSTGACTWAELAAGAEAILARNRDLIILHCISSYPAPLDQMNLMVLPRLREMFGCMVGFSDHTTGSEAACAAVALGARVFEKHLTLDRSLPGPDHQASLDTTGMAAYVRAVRGARTALGDGIKRIMPCEENTRLAFSRYMVAGRDLTAGEQLAAGDVLFKKVVDGLPPFLLDKLVGLRLRRPVAKDTPLAIGMFE